ncbi:Flagellar motor switch protein FliN [Methylocystis sp. MJC1]|jgi:flagellar motor switch protein FliN/FliY|nr:Flagellar motor switch protein FliN [Methylocystis sp. MJC1]MBU6525730.1 flagellar motor switch protein FliN [Methylocystis sp. MJC1]
MDPQSIEQFEQLGMEDMAEPAPAAAKAHETDMRPGAPKIDTILQIPVVLQVVVGSTTLPVADLLNLGRGAVIPLDSRVGDPVEIMINGREIARGEVVVIEDDNTRFGVSLTEIRDPNLSALQQ